MSYCSKRAPSVDSVVRPTAYRTISGVRSRAPAYDTSPQYLADRAFSSVKTANFKRLKAANLPVNYFQAYSGVVTDSYGKVARPYAPYDSYEGYGRQVMGTSISAQASVRSQMWATSTLATKVAAEARLLDNISNMKFNAAQAFAERRQSAQLLINSVNRFVAFAVLFRKGRFADANRILRSKRRLFNEASEPDSRFRRNMLKAPTHREFSSFWLEYSYGWRPLLSDIYGAAELMAQVHTQTRPTRAAGRASLTKVYTATSSSEGLTGRATGTIQCDIEAVVWFDVSSALLDSLKSVGLINPLNLAWELLPYSFVVDWFIPVGQYLNNATATTGLVFKKGSLTYRTKMYATGASTTNNVRWTLDSPFGCSYQFAEVNRAPYTAFPSPSLPSVGMQLNLSQVTSAVALLTQIFTNRR